MGSMTALTRTTLPLGHTMAKRPVFIPDTDRRIVREPLIEFKWVPGMARSQAQKCIASLHEAARRQHHLATILEISSKSVDPKGVALSAFNLRMTIDGRPTPLECVYQASKKFERGGPFTDLLQAKPIDAKRDERLKNSGRLIGFHHGDVWWELEPMTAFYDWLYLVALGENPKLAARVLECVAFSDIAFNPKKSVNCQARSAALFHLLSNTERLHAAQRGQDAFLAEHQRILRVSSKI